MKKMILAMSVLAMMAGMTSCKNPEAQAVLNSEKQEREFLRETVRYRSPDVERVDIIDNTVVYTHIFDGIIDVKTYTYDGDVCVEAERVFTFPDQMSALRHYRRAVEQADLYEDIQMFNKSLDEGVKGYNIGLVFKRETGVRPQSGDTVVKYDDAHVVDTSDIVN